MTPAQCRAACGLLDWTQSALAERSGVTDVTIRNFEKGRTALQPATMQVIRSALTSSDIEFTSNEHGEGVVKLRRPAHKGATEAEMQASADDVRSQAADAVNDALSGSDATDQQKAQRRGALQTSPP
jgi:transcriptional regulator with XRE-family HTH domain